MPDFAGIPTFCPQLQVAEPFEGGAEGAEKKTLLETHKWGAFGVSEQCVLNSKGKSASVGGPRGLERAVEEQQAD